jgi:hypothetical protein
MISFCLSYLADSEYKYYGGIRLLKPMVNENTHSIKNHHVAWIRISYFKGIVLVKTLVYLNSYYY